jgi:hypothetical protein
VSSLTSGRTVSTVGDLMLIPNNQDWRVENECIRVTRSRARMMWNARAG